MSAEGIWQIEQDLLTIHLSSQILDKPIDNLEGLSCGYARLVKGQPIQPT